MNSLTTDSSHKDVISTLVLALGQSQALIRVHEEHQALIARLRTENEQLRQELHRVRSENVHSDIAAQATAQIEQMFVRDAEKQAEIDRLRRSVQVLEAKERKWKSRHPESSSPLVLSEDLVGRSSSPLLRSVLLEPEPKPYLHSRSNPTSSVVTTPSKSPLLKRKRDISIEPLQPLQAINGNSRLQPEKNVHIQSRDVLRKDVAAIPSVAEDGENFAQDERSLPTDQNLTIHPDSEPYHRLENLLSAPSPGHLVLPKKENRPIQPATPDTAQRNQQQRLQPEPSCKHMQTESTQPSDSKRPRFLPPKARVTKGLEDDEPLRARPVNRLDLSHFKLNPLTNSGLDYAFDETIRNRDQRKCLPGCTRPECCGGKFKAIATTLKVNSNISEDDMLLGFLGPGSEDRISSLTTIARENLLHEAWAKRLANEYGKMHRNNHERAQSPVDFWNADMPSTQEGREIREQARLREREEVAKRYQEACREGGMWMFADE